MRDANKCPDCGFELDYSDEDVPSCFRCDADSYQRMYRRAAEEIARLREALEHIANRHDEEMALARTLHYDMRGWAQAALATAGSTEGKDERT